MDGSKTRFWKDIWHEKGNMEDLFPDIYNLSMFQQNAIAYVARTLKVNRCMSDPPKIVYSWRIRHGCGIKSEGSAQLRL